ncbi:hypothetical protein ACFVHB_07955 [Kitasatospora sp. NPDC127111]
MNASRAVLGLLILILLSAVVGGVCQARTESLQLPDQEAGE